MEGWTVGVVMDYYGKWIEDEECAKCLMEEVRKRTPQFYKMNLSSRMRSLRILLMEEYGHTDIPFVTRYRHKEGM